MGEFFGSRDGVCVFRISWDGSKISKCWYRLVRFMYEGVCTDNFDVLVSFKPAASKELGYLFWCEDRFTPVVRTRGITGPHVRKIGSVMDLCL